MRILVAAVVLAITAACGGRAATDSAATVQPGTFMTVYGWLDLGLDTWSKCDAYGNLIYIRRDRIVVIEKGCK